MILASETLLDYIPTSCIVVTVHVVKRRQYIQYSAYIVYINASTSTAEMEALNLDSDKF